MRFLSELSVICLENKKKILEFLKFALLKGITVLSIQGNLWKYFRIHGSQTFEELWKEFWKKKIEPPVLPREYKQVVERPRQKWTGKSLKLDNLLIRLLYVLLNLV